MTTKFKVRVNPNVIEDEEQVKEKEELIFEEKKKLNNSQISDDLEAKITKIDSKGIVTVVFT